MEYTQKYPKATDFTKQLSQSQQIQIINRIKSIMIQKAQKIASPSLKFPLFPPYFLLLLVILLQSAWTLSLKIGNPVNPNLQTGQSTLFSSSLPLNTTSTYLILYPNTMSTPILETAVGVAGLSYIIERHQGYSLYIIQANETQMTIQMLSNYDLGSPSSMVYFLKVRWVVSCHPNLDIDYAQYNFTSTDNLTDPFTYDQGCFYIRCRRKVVTAVYGSAKATALSITGIAFLSGYIITNVPQNGQLSIPTTVNWGTSWSFSNYTNDDYYGVGVSIGGYGTTSCQITISVYGLVSLSMLQVYYFTYETTLTNTYKTRVVSGSDTIGCYYDSGGCTLPWKIKVWSNSTISSAATSIKTFFNNMYFFGLSHFIIHHQMLDSDFTASLYTDPAVKMSFDVTSSALKTGTDVYQSTFNFAGNSLSYFTLRYSYLIDLNFDCPATGDIYHISSTQCDSACPSNFYPNSTTKYCFRCSSRCFQCTGPTNNDCTSCYTTAQRRVLVGSVCVCQTLYYFQSTTSDVCADCSYTCLTCNAAGTSNCLSCNLTDNRYDDLAGSCPCNPGYYDNGGKTCVACHYTCATCTGGGNANNCLTCPSMATTFRNISGTQCNCITGYMHTGSVICSKCLYSCKSCQNNALTNCSACQATHLRTLNAGANTCPCNIGYYDDGFNGLCLPCFVTCRTCNGPAVTDCTGCRGTDPRALNSPTGQCLCTTGYYDFNNTCIACHYTCLNCTSNTATTCLNCNAGQFRTFNTSTSTCPCNAGYYDLLSNPSTSACQACDPTCATCQTTLTKCLSCRVSDYRELVSNACKCIFGYVDVLGTCLPCHYSCDTCSGTLASQCLTCNMTERFPSGTSCLCRPGTYDNGMIEACQPCHIHCLECTGGTNQSCTVCDSAMKRFIPAVTPNYCFCTTHYYNSGPAACSTCFSQCQNCTYNSTYCLTCYATQFRTINAQHKCECLPHYYDTGADTCLICANQCYQCSMLSTNCTSCPVLRTLANNTCVCNNGYYDDPVGTSTCLACGPLCKQCASSSTQCTLCYTNMNRYLSNQLCICSYGYYYDGSNVICQACPYYCQNCTSPTICLQCSNTSHRYLSGGLCRCSPGFYDNGASLVCLACSPVCAECSDYAVCTLCDGTLHRSITLGDCVCTGKYYNAYTLANPVTMCQPCHYSCATCTAGTSSSCLTCEPNRNFTSYSCPCNDGYYQSLQLCYPCDPICRTCVGLPTNCTSCFSGLPLTNNTCLCYSGQYLSGSTCLPCDPKCKECLGVASYCTECYPAHFTIKLNNDCICLAGTYKNPTTLVCTACHATCMECSGPTANDCTACNASDPINRIMSGTSCICKPNYYLSSTNNSCLQCYSSCVDCIGPSDYNCSTCQAGYILIASYCRNNASCLNYLYEGQCVNICPKNSYPTAAHTCQKCINGCLYCMSDVTCLECLSGYFYNSTTATCLPICATGQYIDAVGVCRPCLNNCLECQWNAAKNAVTCLRCAALYYLKDGACSLDCNIPYYYPIGSLCLKCLGNCLTCNSLVASDCVLCKDGTNFLNGNCYASCPSGYFRQQIGTSQPTCEPCSIECSSCLNDKCLSCALGYHISNGRCVQNGYFYNPNALALEKCHPNCLSCTNTSFASCITCQQFRGDKSQLAISGYCECHEGSLDMGNGVCDFQRYTQLLKMTDSLVSFSSSTLYLTALTSIVATNYVGMLAMFGYMQGYSNFYYLNSTMVMRTDQALKQYRKANVNSYFRAQTQPTTSGRLLVELQNDKSLFLRDQPYMYLIQWALIPALAIAATWAISLTIYFILKCCFFTSNQVTNQQSSCSESVPQHNNKPKPKTKKKKIKEYLQRFFSWFHQSVAIVLLYIFSMEIMFYGIGFFKIVIAQNGNIKIVQLVLSVLLFAYNIAYTLRLLVGAYNIAKNNSRTLKKQSPIRVIFHMHMPPRNKLAHCLYFPLTILKNHLLTILIIAFSFSPVAQLVSSGVLLLLFTIYSLIYCPYRPGIRIFMHLSEIALIMQVLMMLLVTSVQYGAQYSLDVLSGDGALYRFAWALIALNYLQIVIYMLLGFAILLGLGINRLCKKKAVSSTSAHEDIIHQAAGVKKSEKVHSTQESCEYINIDTAFEREIQGVEDRNYGQTGQVFKKKYRVKNRNKNKNRKNVFDEEDQN